MMTLTASPRTIKTTAQVTRPRPTVEAARTSAPAAPRPGFWMTLLRALATPTV
jgi:hypothetical protein